MKDEIKELIDSLKEILFKYDLLNTGNEYTILIQIFLYKYLNDKFAVEAKRVEPKLNNNEWEKIYASYSENDINSLLSKISTYTPKFLPNQLIKNLCSKEKQNNFGDTFDNTLLSLSKRNKDTFSIKTTEETTIPLFSGVCKYIADETKRNNFAKEVLNTLTLYSFEEAINKADKYNFFSNIFQYLIKDYKVNNVNLYNEYYTPKSLATLICELLVDKDKDISKVTCYDPSVGTGTLLLALAHKIGEGKAKIYGQDISQRSIELLKLNMVLNDYTNSLANMIQGDTLTNPYHMYNSDIRKFDYIVSNPPFTIDYYNSLEELNEETFWAGVPVKKNNLITVYTLFIQHIINSLLGKAAIIVPTGFTTAKIGVENKILKKIVDDRLVYGVITIPGNIVLNKKSNVSIILLDKNNTNDSVVLIDASQLGEQYTEGNIKKTKFTDKEINKIINTCKNKETINNFSVCVNYEEIIAKNYSLAATHYYNMNIELEDISEEEFNNKMNGLKNELKDLFEESEEMNKNLIEQLDNITYSK